VRGIKMNKKIRFTLHTEEKLKRLLKIGVAKERILEIIENPEMSMDTMDAR